MNTYIKDSCEQFIDSFTIFQSKSSFDNYWAIQSKCLIYCYYSSSLSSSYKICTSPSKS